ncbi:MAG TPA: 6-carboxytetrahydropterin synthase [Chloroflexota bacterium]|nr:6-carboxytetrahydropterin synthase [Chloroflexota bacterium]
MAADVNQVVVGGYGTIGFRAVRLLAHGEVCQPLHGRSFNVRVTLSGDLGPTGRIIDFGSVAAALSAFCAGLEGRILVPLRNPAMEVWQDGDLWHIVHSTRRWTLPDCDVVALDVVNPTNEMLAALCIGSLRRALHDNPEAGLLHRVEVAVGDPEGSAHRSEPWRQA